jgi:PAS domain S-box-containing protein
VPPPVIFVGVVSDPQGEFAPDAPPALRASEVPFRLLVEAVEDYAIFMLDPDARIVSWNAGARRIKGYEADEVLGRPLSLFYTSEDVEAGEPQRLLDQARRQGHVAAEGWRVRKDGSRFWATATISALRGDDGNLLGYAKITRDRSASKAYEDELARSNADLEVFAGVISHDLREPLQLITAFAELLDERLADADTDIRRLVERIGRAARRMREMLDGVRAWSRVGGPSARGMHDVDLTELTADVVDTLGPALAERGIEITVGTLPTVRGDGPQIGQVLQNLIANAAKFASRVEVSAERENGAWVISVADDGPGIPPNKGEEIFGMFTRLDRESSAGGSGIGLAVAARVVGRHGGRIWVERRPGGGSVFRFSLPPEPAG